MRHLWSTLTFACLAVAGMAQNGATYAVSRTATQIADAPSRNVRVSGSGRYVFFDCKATNLVSGAGPAQNVYRYDRQTQTLELVSFATAGGAANGDCFLVSVSDNGRYALFSSEASNLIATDNGLHTDVFRTDLDTRTTVRVSQVAGVDGNSNSYGLDMDPSGTRVVFATNATNLTTGNLGSAVMWEAGNLTTVFSPATPYGSASAAVISSDGTKVVIEETYFDPDPTSNFTIGYVHLKNLVTQAQSFIAPTFPGTMAASRDANIIAFELVNVHPRFGPQETGFIRVQNASSNTHVDYTGALAALFAPRAANVMRLSPDGRFLAFASGEPNWVPGDFNDRYDTFLMDRTLNRVYRTSCKTDGTQLPDHGLIESVSLSNDGSVVGFSSSAPQLDSIDSNVFADAYVHESAFGPAMSATIAGQNPATLSGGASATLRVTWSAAVPPGGTTLRIFAPSMLSVPTHIAVPAGQTEALILVTANHPSTEQVIKVRLVNRDVEALVPVTIKPQLKSVDFVSPQLGGSQVTQANVVLSGPAGSNGATVSLSSSNPTLLQLPATVMVASGQTSRSFPAVVGNVNTNQNVTVTARLLGYTFTRQVTISLWINSLVPTVPTVIGGNPTAARIFLVQPAPAGGLVVTLSKNSAKLSIPATVTVPAGSNVASFSISTSPVTVTTATTVYASYGGYSRAAAVTLEPNTVASLALSPLAVKGGNASLATVTLTAKAATGGLSVALSSNSPKATVPSNLSIPAGSQSKTFYVLTLPTTSAVSATISASLHGVTRVQSLTINP